MAVDVIGYAEEHYYADLVRESPDLELFTEFCNGLVTQQRDPLVLHDFQRLALCDYFLGATVTVVIQPKKQGKTTLIAALCIFHVLTTADANVVIVAVSKDQARRLYEHVCKFISKNPELQKVLDIKQGTNEIRSKLDRGIIKVLSADEETLEGIEPTLAVVDEFGQFKTAEAWGPLNEGLDTRNGRIVVISNAGSDETGPLGTLRASIQKHGIERRGSYRQSRSPEGKEVLHEWALDPGQDVENLAVVKGASPAPWTTLDTLARRRATTLILARWQRMTCGLWVKGGEHVIQPWEWDELAGVEIPAGVSVFVGVDFAFKRDCTALVPHYWNEMGQRVFGTPIILSPPEGEGRLDNRAVTTALEVMAGFIRFDRASFIADLSRDNDREDVERWADAIGASDSYNVAALVYDPYGVEDTMQTFLRSHRALRAVEFSQKDTNLSRADGRFMEAIRSKLVRHNGHAEMREHVTNAVETPTFGGREFKFDHPKDRTKPMDALRAASMAHDAAVAEGGTGPAKKPRRVMVVI